MNENGKVNFIYSFVGKGSVTTEHDSEKGKAIKRNRVFLDVGNKLTCGVIDQHQSKEGIFIQGKRYQSVASILYACPNLVLDNIDEDADKVEIVVHNEPDFDCFVSAFLAEEIIKNKSFPNNGELLVDYAEEVDSGRMSVENGNISSAFAIACAIPEIIKQEKSEMSFQEQNKLTMEKGLELVRYIMNRLKSVNQGLKSLYSPIIFSAYIKNPFEKEIALLNNDYKEYLEDLKDHCEKKRIRLPEKKEVNPALIEVDALFWKETPRCILHKYWARGDKNSPSGTGYVFTFIPSNSEPVNELKLAKLRENGVVNLTQTNKVILSVDPKSNLCLKGLGAYLETAECEKEIQLGIEKFWRERSSKRFEDSWCDNLDPWFDGRSFDYTIVDSPREGSLLTIDEIKDKFIDYTKTKVTRSFNRFVLPFNFDYKRYKNIIGILDNHKNIELKASNTGDQNYFLDFINKYLFSNDNTNDVPVKNYVYKLKDIRIFDEIKQDLSGTLDSVLPYFGIKKVNISVFKYGMGIAYFDLEKSDTNTLITLDDILRFNRAISNVNKEGKYDILENIFSDEQKRTNNISERYFMIWNVLELHKDTVYKSEIEEMVYKVSNLLNWDDPYTKCTNEEKLNGERLCFIGEYATFGFSKNGGALILVDDDDLDKRTQRLINNFYEDYKDKYFNIFLISLQKRQAFVNIANCLAEYQNKRKQRYIRSLRELLLDFLAQGSFTQITNNELGMQFYNKWESIFECEKLYEEVKEQLEIIDDFYINRFNSRFQVISSIFFPAVTISTLYQIGFIKLDPLMTITKSGNGNLTLYWFSILVAILVLSFAMYFYWNYKGKK